MDKRNKILLTVALLAVAGAFGYTQLRNSWQRQPSVSNQEDVSNKGLSTQTNTEGEVSVAVTLKDISPGSSRWSFEVGMNTHSAELNVDLMQATVLVADSGKEFKPLSYEGAPAGGHHRDGVLYFSPITPRPKSIELRIAGIAGVPERIFKWNVE